MGDGVIRISPVQFFRKDIMSKKYKIIANEIRTYEFEVLAKDYEDACFNWHNYLSDVNYKKCEDKADIDRVWKTESVFEKGTK